MIKLLFIIVLFLIGLVFAGAYLSSKSNDECKARGGVYVRTGDGYRCIDAKVIRR
jgi:hypothetical protein